MQPTWALQQPASTTSFAAGAEVTVDTALRLARHLGTSAEFWLGLQLEYDLRLARPAKLKEIERVVQPRAEAA